MPHAGNIRSIKLVLLLALPALLCGCGRKAEPLDALLRKSFAHAEQADWKSAKNLAEKVLDRDASNTSARVLLSLSLENLDRMDQAIVQAEKAANQDSESFMAQYTYGRMLLLLDRHEQSIKPLNRAVELDPEDVNALLLLSRAQARIYPAKASASYGKLLKNFQEFKNSGVIFNELAVLELLKNNPDTAASFFFQAARFAPDNPDIIRNCAIFCEFHPNSLTKFLNRTRLPGDMPSSAKEFYAKYLLLTAARPELERERLEVERHLNSIR